MTLVEGKEVKVGDYVGFKCDIEQSGKIIAINGNQLTLSSGCDPFEGGYIGGKFEYTEDADRCWIE